MDDKIDAKTKAEIYGLVDRIIPHLNDMAEGKLKQLNITTETFSHNYNPASSPTAALVHMIYFTVNWTGLDDSLQKAVHTSYSQHRLGVGTGNNFVASMAAKMRNALANQAKREALLARGGANAVRLESVLAWYLADKGVNPDHFRSKAMACGNSPTAKYRGIHYFINDDVIEGQFNLSPEVKWRKGVLTIKGHTMPIIMTQAFVGKPANDLVDHPALKHLLIKKVQSFTRDKAGKSTIVVQTKVA